MASNPPDQCCTIGVKHEGTATGEIKDVGGISTYLHYPKDGSTTTAVLVLTDVIGHEFINAQLIADQFAANGYFTVMPDLFQGDAVPLNRPEGFNIQTWLQGPPSKSKDAVDPIVTKIIKAMRDEYKVKHIGAAGYCFGAKYVTRFMGDIGSKNNAMIDAGFNAHPSFVDEEELKAITGPLSIAAAETDEIFPTDKRRQSEDILKELSVGKQALPYEMTLYGGVSHGFAVRGDPSDKRAKFAKEKAFLQAVQWFDLHLRGKGLN